VAITRARQSLRIVADESNPSIFLEELRAPGTPPSSAANPTGIEAPDQGSSKDKRQRRGAPAVVGLQFSWGGYHCTVSTVVDDGVVVSIGPSTMTIPFGSEVTLEGRVAVLSRPAKESAEKKSRASTGTESAVSSALRAWRLERSRRDGVPAYVVFDDKTLEAIVLDMPSTERQLLAVSGMGPKRVELYGNDVLSLLNETQTQD
jgi:hypothetical protein